MRASAARAAPRSPADPGTPRARRPEPKPSGAIFPTQRFVSSRLGTSRWRPMLRRSARRSESFSGACHEPADDRVRRERASPPELRVRRVSLSVARPSLGNGSRFWWSGYPGTGSSQIVEFLGVGWHVKYPASIRPPAHARHGSPASGARRLQAVVRWHVHFRCTFSRGGRRTTAAVHSSRKPCTWFIRCIRFFSRATAWVPSPITTWRLYGVLTSLAKTSCAM